jgi:hypothetical protein
VSTRYVPNPAQVGELGRSKQLLDELMKRAEEAADKARGLAPVDSGDYRDGIEVDGGVDGSTVVARVNANDWKSGLIEFGTGRPAPTPAYAPLRRGAEQAGLKVEATR